MEQGLQRIKQVDTFALSSKDLFYHYDHKRIKGKGNVCIEHGAKSKKQLAQMLYTRFLEFVVDDIIENNTTVQWYNESERFMMGVRQVPKHHVARYLDNDLCKFSYLDMDFKAYALMIWQNRNSIMQCVSVDWKRQNRILELGKEGHYGKAVIGI